MDPYNTIETLKYIADAYRALRALAPLIKEILEWLWILIYIRWILLPQVAPDSYPKTAWVHRIAVKTFVSCKFFASRVRFWR